MPPTRPGRLAPFRINSTSRLGAGGFQIFRDPLSVRKERQRLAGSRRFVEDRAERTGFIQFGEQQPLRPEYLESIHHTG